MHCSKDTAQFLYSLPGASERLKLFEADLVKPGSFLEAFQGCDYVLHTASPFKASVPKGKRQEVLIDPAVKGTENVLGEAGGGEGCRVLAQQFAWCGGEGQ